eukprot:scpid7995/ scgid0951/ Putative ATP-dependent RNA helicase TDRD9; Tudor domain-containing protein 9
MTSYQQKFAAMHLGGASGGVSDVPMDELEDEESSRRLAPRSEVAGAHHPSITADSHFGNLSTAETFRNYYKNETSYDAKLPITGYRDNIISTIESNSVVVIQGSTGSGKTTQVPQYLLDRAQEKQEHCNIIVTQPRRIAAVSVARRICSERNWTLGGLVGYQIAMNRMLSEDTRLTFCTTGVLLEKLIQNKNMTQYTHVILDEVHERDDEIDMAMLVVRKMLRSNSRHVKVILMSATIASEEFSDYFGIEIQGVLQNAPVLTVEGRMYPVQEHYLDDFKWLVKDTFFSDIEDNAPAITDYAQRMCMELIRLFDTMEVDQEVQGYGRGTVLVFLPGMGEIQDMTGFLGPITETERLQIVPLHSKVHFEDQQRAFLPPEEGRRKVILATNIAESSITVPDVCYVIDFCLVKHLVLDDTTNYSALRTCWASRASLLQRQGRAGRVQSGHCYRLIPKKFFRESIPDYSVPEMQRQSLEQVVLRVKMLDMGDPQSLLGQALSPPNLDRVAKTVLILKQVGALSLQSTGSVYDGDLTFAGKIMAQLPVDVRVARMLLLGHVFGYLNECLVIGASLSLRSIFTHGYKEKKLQAFRNKLTWANGSQSDSFASLYAYMEWKLKNEENRFRNGRAGERQWGNSFSVHIQRMKEVDLLVRELRSRMEKFNIIADRSLAEKARHGLTPNDQFMLKIILSGAFYPFYFGLRREEDAAAVKMLSGHDQLSTVQIMGMPPTASMYEKEITQLFRECGKVAKIHFEASTKAFVEFERPKRRVQGTQQQQQEENGVLQAVTLALKMRHIRYPLSFELDPKKDAAFSEKESRARFQIFYGQAPVEQQQHRTLPQHDLSKLHQMEVLITEIVTVSEFWVQMTESSGELSEISEWIYRRRNSFKALRSPTVGMVCVALWSEDMNYYRVCINDIRDSDNTAGVTFLDFGNSSRTVLAELKECPEHLFKIKQQALKCSLRGVSPSTLEAGHTGHWSNQALQLFSDLTYNKRIWAQIYSTVDNVIRCDLVDTSDPDRDISVCATLVSQNAAEAREETTESKLAHERRLAILEGRQVPQAVEAAAASASSWRDQFAFSKAPVEAGWTDAGTSFGDGSYQREREEINVKGPYSAYELQFCSMTKTHHHARVERDSVNSAAVDDLQTSGFKRMAVAATVGLAPSGFNVIVRESTVMPNIKGLPALITMLFCPTLEMRTDPFHRYYIGCLCGSGSKANTDVGANPDDDIEVVFDVEFDQQDLVDINAIRHGMNIALADNGNFEKVKWAGGPANRLQRVQQEKIMKLFQRDRKGITSLESSENEYKWNKVHAEEVVHAETLDGSLQDAGPIPFMYLHNGIRLQSDDVLKRKQQSSTSSSSGGGGGIQWQAAIKITEFIVSLATGHGSCNRHQLANCVVCFVFRSRCAAADGRCLAA